MFGSRGSSEADALLISLLTQGQASTDVLRASVVESIVGGISHAYVRFLFFFKISSSLLLSLHSTKTDAFSHHDDHS